MHGRHHLLGGSHHGPTFWAAASWRKPGHVPLDSADNRADMQISPDGRLLAISYLMPNDYYGHGDVAIIDLAQRKKVMRFSPVAGGALAFSADGRFLVTADPGGADVIDLTSHKVRPRRKAQARSRRSG
ncbi:hypothetical protein [Nonomuraea sp. 10N515B]|uniref:hypothetical protein n=1 Tax=Nonomuraea sp. 10N515B TaxID=3457422 RepID=UPI003FCE5E1D